MSRSLGRSGLVLRWMLVLGVGVLVVPLAGSAQGWIEPPAGRQLDQVVRLETDVRVSVVDQVAQVEVTEWFENRSRGVAEGTYLYPLPGEAVFSGFSLWQGEQELRGEILDAREARTIYEGIVRRRADPALIELAGSGLLRARVFPIEPGQRRRVTLRYTQVLGRSGDALQFRYAAGTGGASNIFPVPGPQPLPMPRPRPAEGEAAPEREDGALRLELVAENGDRFLAPFSPTHTLTHARRGERLIVRTEGELRGRLSVFLPLARAGVGLSLVTHRTPGEEGYFMLTLSPGTAEAALQPRDVTMVMDVSGSMSGAKMEQARSAMLRLLESLSPQDRFRLIAFSSGVRPESEDWRPARPAELAQARAWVESLRAEGGTNISGALDEGLRLESPPARLPVVIFLTDGLPTAGERSAEVIAQRAEGARGRARVFAFGVGHDVDTHLLDALSAATRGSTTYVDPNEDVERALELLAAKVRHPVLTDLQISGVNGLTEIYPVVLPDLFAGEALVLFGRFRQVQQGDLRITGLRSGQRASFATRAAFPALENDNDYIPRLWASRKVGHLSRQIRLEGSTPELVEEIRQTALRYGLPSEYTSYLVQEPEMAASGVQFRTADGARGGIAGGRAVPQAAPPPPTVGAGAGLRLDEIVVTGTAGAARRREVGNTVAQTSGADAVRVATEEARMRDARSNADLAQLEREQAGAGPAVEGSLRQVAGRAFVLRSGVWTEAQPAQGTAPRVVAVKLYSAAYFELLRALPELTPMAQALGRLEVRGQSASVRLDEAGRETLTAAELAGLVRDFRGAAPGL
jgi:Ca-activated chloride channel family protein